MQPLRNIETEKQVDRLDQVFALIDPPTDAGVIL